MKGRRFQAVSYGSIPQDVLRRIMVWHAGPLLSKKKKSIAVLYSFGCYGACYSWRSHYEREIENFESDCTDVGEIWFGKKTMKSMVEFVERHWTENQTIVEFGMGNGVLLLKLLERSERPNRFRFLGLDYAPEAVKLARSIAAANEHGDAIVYESADLTDVESVQRLCAPRSVDILLDKGTLDAISLHPERTKMMSLYKGSILRVLRSPSGIFLIASCNFTRSELIEQFSPELALHEEVPTKQLVFGGVVGRSTTILALRFAS